MERIRANENGRPAPRVLLRHCWQVAWPIVRSTIGWCCIVLGLVGLVLPVLQGVLLLVIGISLVGRRHRLIRWSGVHCKLLLRRWAMVPTPLVGTLGRLALRSQQEVSRQRRRLHWWYEARRRQRALLRDAAPD